MFFPKESTKGACIELIFSLFFFKVLFFVLMPHAFVGVVINNLVQAINFETMSPPRRLQ
jgi:hypothetical protein